jgi:hypothetical protein
MTQLVSAEGAEVKGYPKKQTDHGPQELEASSAQDWDTAQSIWHHGAGYGNARLPTLPPQSQGGNSPAGGLQTCHPLYMWTQIQAFVAT